MAESYTDNEMRGLLKEESITPQPIAPPIVDPPPIEKEKEVVPYTQLDAVREVALKFDPGKPGHNNPGNTNWSPRIQNELGDRVTKGDTYIDNAGVQRWVAKFDTPDTGQQEMNGVTARIWEESGYDPTKFAETYTGTRPEDGHEKYQTVINYANEINRINDKNSNVISDDDMRAMLASDAPPPTEPDFYTDAQMQQMLSPVNDPTPAPAPEEISNELTKAAASMGYGAIQGVLGTAESFTRMARVLSGGSYGNSRFDGAIDKLGDINRNWDIMNPNEVNRIMSQGTASMVQSALSGIPGLAIGLVGGAPSGPGALVSSAAGFAISTGVVFSVAEYDQFMEDITKHAMEVYGITDPTELAQMRAEVFPEASVSALAEGGFEALSNTAALKVMGFFGAKTIIKPAKLATKEIVTRYFKKIGLASSFEVPSEMATTAVQMLTREEAGLPAGDVWEAMKDTVGPAIFQSMLTMGFGSVINGRYEDTSNNRKVLKDQMMGVIDSKGVKISEEEVDGLLAVIDGRAETMGVSANDFIGTFIASVDNADPTLGDPDQLFQMNEPIGTERDNDVRLSNPLGRFPDRQELMSNKATQIINEKMPDNASGTDVMNMLRNNGVTKGELEWYGLEDFMGEDVSKEEVLTYIGLLGNHAGLREWSALSQDPMVSEEAWFTAAERSMSDNDIGDALETPVDRDPEYESFSLKGNARYYGENVLFFNRDELQHLSYLNPLFGSSNNPGGYVGQHFGKFRSEGMPDTDLGHYRYSGFQTPIGDDVFFLEELQSDIHQAGASTGYSTWEDISEADNAISEHDAYIMELVEKYKGLPTGQSKWGDRVGLSANMLNNADIQTLKPLLTPEDYHAYVMSLDRFLEAQQFRTDQQVPPIPFKKTWMNVLVKRALLDAMDHDAKYFAWTSGAIQTKRWGDLEVQWKTSIENGPIQISYRVGHEANVDPAGNELPGGRPSEDIMEIFTWDGVDINEGIAEFKAIAGDELGKFAGKIFNAIDKNRDGGNIKPHKAIMNLVYDKKIAQIIKKLTGLEPGQIDLKGVLDNTKDKVFSQMGIPLTDAVKRKILKASKTLFQDEKASVQFLDDGRAVIRMAKGADISSLIHEVGHIFRRTMTPQQLKLIEDSYGAIDGLWTTEAEEKWARGFERWVRTGTTSNQKLQPVFKDFKTWMTRIYKRIKGSSIEGQLSNDMRKFFDRMIGQPTDIDLAAGVSIISQMGGSWILNKSTKDISMLAAYLGSPENVAEDFPEAQQLISEIIEAEFRAQGRSQEDYESFKEAERLALSDLGAMAGNPFVRALTPKRVERQLKKVRAAVDLLSKGTEEDIKKLQQEQPGVYEAAKILRKYFDGMRDNLKDYKRDMYIRQLTGGNKEAFLDLMNIITKNGTFTDAEFDTVVENHKLDREVFDEIIKGFTDIDNWGIDDYITNMERGMYKITEGVGKHKRVIAIGVTKKHAVQKAKEWLALPENVGQDWELTVDTSAGNFDPHAQLSRTQYWQILGKIKESYEGDFKEIQDALTGSLYKGIVIKPTKVFAGPTRKRKDDGLQGEENIFDAMYTYSHVVQKKIALDPVIHDARSVLAKLPPQMRSMVESMVEYAKGKYSFGDQLLDNMFEAYGGRPMIWTRFVGKVRSGMAKLKLGYRPVAAFINFTSGQGHTWVKFGFGYMGRGRTFLKTEKGKDFLRRQEKYLGTAFSVDTSGKSKSDASWWSPLSLFSAVEVPNRKINAAAAYLYAIDQGMDEGAAESFARKSVRFTQFTYNASSLPRILRSPTGKLAGQFKPYLAKEIEFIRGLKGTGQIMKYLGLQMALAGPRGMIWVLRSLPILGMLGLWDEWEEWMNDEHPEIPIAGDNIPTLSRGVVGLVGGDITLPATIQLPNKPEDWAGPFLSDAWRLWERVMRPMLEGEKFVINNAKDWAIRVAPFAFYWDQAIQSTVDNDGWVRDRRSGNKLYRVDGNWDRALLAMGVAPDQRSDALMIQRVLQKEEDIRNRNASKVTKEALRQLLEGEMSKEILDDMIELGISKKSIKDTMIRQTLPPELRQVKEARKAKRPRVLDLNE
tara:strand:- start:10431 stop:16589 length:6159 start_codon:yes stop_codon:yes gene_type:complete